MKSKCIHNLFEEIAAARPGALALCFEDKQWTYRELNEFADAVAARLLKAGVKPNTCIGICFQRSLELIGAILGVLKAGGAYVPLDPTYPKDRLAFMLGDTQISILLTQPALTSLFPTFSGSVIELGSEESPIVGDGRNPPVDVTPESLAYVMYTSGSTGQPKGVMVPHRAVVRLVRDTNYCNFDPSHVFLQLAPISFDASTFEIWGALLNGARLAIMPPAIPSLDEIGAAIARHGVTTLWLTSGLFNIMVERNLEALRPLKQLLAGGDVLSSPHVQRVVDTHSCKVINGYGPTEGTTFTCCHVMHPRQRVPTSVPIGVPISQTRVYILDENRHPVERGVAGELWIGGEGLALGYWNRPELTREKFADVVLDGSQPSRLYRTGDLARYVPDGAIEFLGRADNQIKLNGFRIELGEIEAALSCHHAVRDNVVVVRQRSNAKRIVAYIVPANGSLNIHNLRAHLSTILPHYMLPSAFVEMREFPLNANGKVDRHALPDPKWQAEIEPDRAIESKSAPSELAAALVEIWREVLNLDDIGLDQNFFEVGGDSLNIIAVQARVEERFKLGAQITTFFDNPTINTLANALGGSQRNSMQSVQARARRQRIAMGLGR